MIMIIVDYCSRFYRAFSGLFFLCLSFLLLVYDDVVCNPIGHRRLFRPLHSWLHFPVDFIVVSFHCSAFLEPFGSCSSRCFKMLQYTLPFFDVFGTVGGGVARISRPVEGFQDDYCAILMDLWDVIEVLAFWNMEKKINVWIPGPFEGFQDDYCGILTGPEYFFGDSLNSQKILFRFLPVPEDSGTVTHVFFFFFK